VAILFSDPFTYANDLLATVNANWPDHTGTVSPFRVLSNVVTLFSGAAGNDHISSYSGITWPADIYAQVNVTITGTTDNGAGIGPAVRMVAGVETFYSMVCDHAASNNIRLSRSLAGVHSTLGNRTQAFTDGAAARLQALGTVLTMSIDGVPLGADISDAGIASGRAGIRYSSSETSASLDDFEGGDAVVAGGVTDGWKVLLH
jgi:hypothetical protein